MVSPRATLGSASSNIPTRKSVTSRAVSGLLIGPVAFLRNASRLNGRRRAEDHEQNHDGGRGGHAYTMAAHELTHVVGGAGRRRKHRFVRQMSFEVGRQLRGRAVPP